jgi:membrane protease YdiL (CAAX protease family)
MNGSLRTTHIRRLAYLLLFASYPVAPLMVHLHSPDRGVPHLPPSVVGLLDITLAEAALFLVWFGAGWLLIRPSRDQLLVRRLDGLRPVITGLSVAVMLWLALALVGAVALLFATNVMHVSEQTLQAWRPRVDRLVSSEVLRRNPLYLVLATTIVSFGLAGFREELWRSALLFGVRSVWPRSEQSRSATAVTVFGVALLFGLGHWPQGRGGIVATVMLGTAFGGILVRRDSLWEAVFAHGFFDAANFLLLAVGNSA